MENEIFELLDLKDDIEGKKNSIISYFTDERKLKLSIKAFWDSQPNEYGNGTISKAYLQELFDKLKEKEIVNTILVGTDYDERQRAEERIKNILSSECSADINTILFVWNNYLEILKDAISSKVSDEDNITANRIEDNIINTLSVKQDISDGGIREIKSSTERIESKLNTLFENSNTPTNSSQFVTNVQQSTLIVDDNEEFKKKYSDKKKAKLFLEDKPILLKDVYVEPKVDGYNSLAELFDKWLNESDTDDDNYTEFDTPVLLLCGKAGIGKTSLVSELISNDFFNGKAHAVFLRKKVDCFDSSYSSYWESVKKAFDCDDDDEYKNKILIIDGFDELCVLKSNFIGKDFLENLSLELPDDVKVLITSREYKGYFDEVINQNGSILVKKIKWTEKEMLDWCDYYSSKRNDTTVAEWCINFKNNYNYLDSERKEIFCTPIILYICCHENIDISQDSTIAEIYDKAFKNIVTREYSDKKLQQETGLSAVDGAVVMWQLIKELAYQMCLNDKLDSGAGTELIQKAKNRVKAIINNNSLTDDILSKMLKKLPTIFHFATENNDGGYEFFHKTVAEYFTAVKIYEDYFDKYDKDYLSKYEDDYFTKYKKDYLDETKLTEKEKEEIDEIKGKVAELWRSFVEAFRYKELDNDILNYLCEMTKGKYNGKKDDNSNGLDNVALKKTYGFGISLEYWSKYEMPPPKYEYYIKTRNLIQQIENIYRNLLMFSQFKYLNCDMSGAYLSCADLRCEDLKFVNLSYADLKSASLNGADLSDANLSNADLCGADLSDANLSNVNFTSAKMKSSVLNDASLIGANLSNVDFDSANLENADLSNANLRNANLAYAYSISADFSNANLNNADLCNSNLVSAKFTDADLISTLLNYADLTGANLNFAKLNFTDLSYADLKDSSLTYANLSSADLSYANLRNADLSYTNLCDADLRCANLDSAELSGAKYNAETKFPNGFNLKEHYLEFVDEEPI